jgi:hypothetical protein
MANPVVKVESVLDEQIGSTSSKVFEDTDVDIVSWTNKGDVVTLAIIICFCIK